MEPLKIKHGEKLPPIQQKHRGENHFRERATKATQPYKPNIDTDLLSYNDKVFLLNRKFYKPKVKPLSLNDIALKILDKDALEEYKKKYPLASKTL